MPLLQIPLQRITTQALRGPNLSASDGSVSYEGHVVTRYLSTKITSDRLVLYPDANRGVAEGHVTMVDPDGTVEADRLEFSSDQNRKINTAENVTIRLGGAILRARHAIFEPGQWTLFDAEGTTCLRPKPVYLVTSEKLVIRPREQLIVNEPRISILGHFIAQIPTQRATLSPAVPGLRYPAPGYKLGKGAGVTWAGGILAGHNATFLFNARSFQQTKPSAYAMYTHSFLPIANATQIVSPRTDFGERFNFGYLDSVIVQNPDEEAKFLKEKRSSLSAGGQLNGSVADRERGTRYTKVEAIYEGGGMQGGVGLLGDVRVQGIQREDQALQTRLALTGSAGLPTVKLAPGVTTIARVDSAAYLGDTTYGWGRALAGLSYSPKAWLRLSGGIFSSFEAGTPQFDIDPLYSKSGALLRADVAFGGFRLSYLAKDDWRRAFYDHEIAINQVIGCVEVFYVLREYPRDRRIGVTLRVQPLIDLVKRRSLEYQPAAKTAPPKKGK